MSQFFKNIEDFVREKLGLLEGDPQPDWQSFERKLKRAIWKQRVRRATGVVGLLLLLGFSQTLIRGDWNEPLKSKSDFLPTTSGALNVEASPATHTKVAAPLRVVHSLSQESASAIPQKRNMAKAAASKNQVERPKLALAGHPLQREAKPEPSSILEPRESFEMLEALELPLLGESLKAIQGNIDEPNLGLDAKRTQSTLRSKEFYETPKSDEPYISPLQEKKPWTYSLNIYPNFAFREFKIDPSKKALLHSDFIDAMQNSERSGINMNVGFEVSRRVGAITYINSGIEYINNSYQAEYDFLNFRNAIFNESTGEIAYYTLRKDPQRIAFSDINSFHFLNIPLSVSYQPWATDHLRINLEFGFSALYFLKAEGSSIDYKTLDLIDLDQRSYRKFMASSSLTIGVQYFVSRNINLGIEPTLMYFTNSIYTEEYPFEVIPYSMGVNFKLQMKLQ